MNSWVYAIGNKQYTFLFKDGSTVDGTGAIFKINIENDNFPKDGIWWHVKQNYSKVEKGDIVYIYATKNNPISGILGVAKVLEKRDDKRKEICLKVDKLLKEPIALNKNCGIPRKSLHSLSLDCKHYICLELDKQNNYGSL